MIHSVKCIGSRSHRVRMFGNSHGEEKDIKVRISLYRIKPILILVQAVAIASERRTLLLPYLRSSAFSLFQDTPGLLAFHEDQRKVAFVLLRGRSQWGRLQSTPYSRRFSGPSTSTDHRQDTPSSQLSPRIGAKPHTQRPIRRGLKLVSRS